MTEIVIDRSSANVMKLSADEQAMMDEIEISTSRPKPMPRKPSAPPPRGEDLHQEEIDAFMNPTKQSAPKPPPVMPNSFDDDEPPMDDFYGDDDYGDDEGGAGLPQEQPSRGYTSVEEERLDLLNKLERLSKKGHAVNRKLNAYSPIEDVRAEIKRVTYSIEVEQGVKFARKMLVACTTGLEFLNTRFNPFELQLEGWSNSVHENLEDYDGVFEELIVKYRSSMKVAPELKLILMLSGSAMMYHLTNSMFKAAIPDIGQVVKQNPDLVKNMMAAVQNTAANNAAQAGGGGGANADGSYEMQGPGVDISTLMNGIMMPPMPMNTRQEEPEKAPAEEFADDVSDIVSEGGGDAGGGGSDDVKEVSVPAAPKKRGRKRKEINL